MLLWHGSRLTNWVGILSKGLRIAPPEAPVTGYMFGKGVYFADMVSDAKHSPAKYSPCLLSRHGEQECQLLQGTLLTLTTHPYPHPEPQPGE